MANGEWWRLITSAFLHAGIFHLATNMLGLYWLGRVLELLIGSWRYLLLYLASALSGAAGALWLSGPYDVTVGASGAIFGILGALLVLERRGAINTGGQIIALIVLNLLISFLPGISIGGHIGGFIGGAILMLLYLQFRRSNAWPSPPRSGRGGFGDRRLRGDLSRNRPSAVTQRPPSATSTAKSPVSTPTSPGRARGRRRP